MPPLVGGGVHHVGDACRKAILAVRGQAQGAGELIRLLKADTVDLSAKTVRVLLCKIHGGRAEPLEDPHGQGRAEILPEKQHHGTHPELLNKGFVDLVCLLGRDPLDVAQPAVLVFDDIQRLLPVGDKDPLCQNGSDALDGTGGKIFQNSGGGVGEIFLKILHSELSPEGGMNRPGAPHLDRFPFPDERHGAHQGHGLAHAIQNANAVSVFRVGIHNFVDDAF